MKNNNKTKIKERKKHKMGWLIALIIVAVLGIGAWIGMSLVFKEHREITGLPLDRVDFERLKDGVYIGDYEGGMYKWRENKVEVTVAGGKVTDIKLLSSKFEAKGTSDPEILYKEIVDEQSLQVDVISGATVTSKGLLQAVENALLQAEQ